MDKYLNWKADSYEENANKRDDNEQVVQKVLKTSFTDRRYVSYSSDKKVKLDSWRIKDRVKTGSVALVICLNIGVVPPDVIKTTPCACLECWIDPFSLPSFKAIESIGRALQMQYERWQPRAQYKICLDPNVETIKGLCLSMRYKFKDERCLFHYNGHGVPMPTDDGEIWVFNKDFTQYVPISIINIKKWLGGPTLYVFDCNAAGKILKYFQKFMDQVAQSGGNSGGDSASEDQILLAACGANEILPTSPDLPADVFTSCLTTPIKIALRWSNSQNIITGISPDLIDQIPGRLNDRRTPLGELNWIFTAVTDTIAWTTFSKQNFQKLFRQDLLVACLFRNFLLAERILRSCRCTPVSIPKLPLTYNHSIWQAWDLVVDYYLLQIPKIVANPSAFKHSTFFSEQLTAFEVWLEFANEDTKLSEQLPIVLQVLLSQQHRMRALILLARFLDLGPWAVNQSLNVGIFPYILKLVESPPELREILIFIWAKILAVDRSCQMDLVKENRQTYFLNSLANASCSSISRMQCAFILSVLCDNCPDGKSACLGSGLIQTCLSQIGDSDGELKFWIVLCIAKLWDNFDEAKNAAISEGALDKICQLLSDPVPEVRAVAVYALGTYFWLDSEGSNENRIEAELRVGLALSTVSLGCSFFVHRELALSLMHLIQSHHDKFLKAIEKQMANIQDGDRNSDKPARVYGDIWRLVLVLALDPVSSVSKVAQHIVDHVQMNIMGKADYNTANKKNTSGGGIASSFSDGRKDEIGASKGNQRSVKRSLLACEHKSNLYEWAKSYFLSPLAHIDEVDYSTADYDERIWRSQINECIMQEALQFWNSESASILSSKKLDNEIAVLKDDSLLVKSMLFHPFDPLVYICGNNKVDVWNWESKSRLNRVVNHEKSNTKISSIHLLNSHDKTLLALGSDDNVVRIWENVKERNSRLLTAWRVLLGVPVLSCKNGVGLVLDWMTYSNVMLATGNVGIIRVWDLVKEMSSCDINTSSDASATCITTNNSEGSNMAVVGFADGGIQLYDVRMSNMNQSIASLNERSGKSILGIKSSSAMGGYLVSCSKVGTLKLWDYRNLSASVRTLSNKFMTYLTGFDVHPQAPIIALGVHDGFKVIDFDGKKISAIKSSGTSNAMGKPCSVESVAFHPYYNLLGVGTSLHLISIYATESFRW